MRLDKVRLSDFQGCESLARIGGESFLVRRQRKWCAMLVADWMISDQALSRCLPLPNVAIVEG